MSSVSKNVYNDKLDNIVRKYDNTYHDTTNVKSNTYIDSSKEMNNRDPKFEIGDTVRI